MKGFKLSLIFAFMVAAISCGPAASTDSQSNITNSSAAANASSPLPTPADQLASGRELYKQNCAICHKEDGTGGKMTIEGKTIEPDDLTSEKIKKFSDEKITGYIVNGVEDEGMPAFKDKLTEAQIREIVDYVRQGIQKMPAEPAKPAS